MVKKQKIIVLLIGSNIMAVTLTGCGSGQTSAQIDSEAAATIEMYSEESDDTMDDSFSGTSSLYQGGDNEYVPSTEAYSDEEWAEINGETITEVNSQIVLPKDIEVGDTVFLGSYEQDNNTSNGKEDIEWIVLAKERNKALVISKYALDIQEYHVSNRGITWETCSLREWLNDDFFNTAFSADEQEIIATSIVSDDKNPEFDTIPSNTTQDKIYLLSIAEAEGYFASSNERQCEATAYGKTNTTFSITDETGNCMWWLRSPGRYYQSSAAYVYCGGGVIYDGADCLYPMGVRPAMQIILDLEAAEDGPTEFTKPDIMFAEPRAEDFVYNYDAVLGGIKITGYVGEDRLIRIPEEIDGDTVKQVAFSYDRKMTQVELPDSVIGFSFGSCTGLEKIVLPDNITNIGDSAFGDCTSLTEITIPDSVTSIGSWAFSGCTSLESITIPYGVTTIEWQTFLGCTSLTEVTIPNSVTEIGSGAFSNCISLTEIEIPDSVTSISGAFSDCTSLTEIQIPYGVTKIESYTFKNCTSLTEVTIPDSVTAIGGGAFSGCTGLRNLKLPDSVEQIGSDAFEGCDGLTVIYKGQEYNYASDTYWW